MNKILILSLLFFFSCTKERKKVKKFHHDPKEITIIQLRGGDRTIILKNNDMLNFLTDLEEARLVGPHKYVITNKCIIKYNNHKSDTIVTNGKLFILNNKHYKTDTYFLDKYL